MKTLSFRAILLTTALFVSASAWAQDQAKSDAAKSDGSAAQADRKTGADLKPLVIDASKPVKVAAKADDAAAKDGAKPIVIDASKDVKVAQENQVPATQDSTDGRAIPGPLRNYERPVLQNNEGAVQAPPPEAFPEEWIPAGRVKTALSLRNGKLLSRDFWSVELEGDAAPANLEIPVIIKKATATTLTGVRL